MNDKLKRILRKMCDKRFCSTEYSYCIKNDDFCDRVKVVLKELGELLGGSGDKKVADLTREVLKLKKINFNANKIIGDISQEGSDIIKKLEAEIAKLREDAEFIIRQDKLLFGKDAVKEIAELTAELDWWHNLIRKHHKNKTCPDLKTYVENLQAKNEELLKEVEVLRKTNEMLDYAVEQDMVDFQRKMDENEKLEVILAEKEKELDEWRTKAVGKAADVMIYRKEITDLKMELKSYIEETKMWEEKERAEKNSEIKLLQAQLKREKEYITLMYNQLGFSRENQTNIIETGKKLLGKAEATLIKKDKEIAELRSIVHEDIEILLKEGERAVQRIRNEQRGIPEVELPASKEELKRIFGNHKPEKPKRLSMIRIIREGDLRSKCPECGSSLKRTFLGLGKSLGCIQPECGNYYKGRVAPIDEPAKCLTIAKGVYVRSLSEGNMVKKMLSFPYESRFSINCVSLQDPDFTILIKEKPYRILIAKAFKDESVKFDLILKEMK